MKRSILFLFGLSLVLNIGAQSHTIKTLTEDGAWCWFSAPGAIYTHDSDHQLVTGWVTADGSIESARLNLNDHTCTIQNVSPQLDKDDHANPSFLELKNKDVLMFYTKHFDQYVRINTLNASGEVQNFGPTNKITIFNQKQFDLYPRKGVTYANPIQLSKEKGRVFCFGRWTGFKPNMMWSDDNGQSFSDAKVYITNKPFNDDNRPYVRYYSDGQSKIHIVFTDGHPRKEVTNSLYYACYEKGAFWKADGTKICDLDQIPFEPKDVTTIYKASKDSGRAWIHDVTADKKGRPVVVYGRYPKETEHLYHYASFNGKTWDDHLICNSGKWFPQTPEDQREKEPHYSGGQSFHSHKSNVVYLSREVDGVFEIERHETNDRGKTWIVTAITKNSKYDNVRPITPRNRKKGDANVVLWMENQKYVYYTDYQCTIKYKIDE